MYVHQLIDEPLRGFSYLIGDTDAAVCAIVDPPLEKVDDILKLVAAKGMRVISVIESHAPVGAGCGCREVARRTGATLFVHELTVVDYPHQKLPDGIFRFFRGAE